MHSFTPEDLLRYLYHEMTLEESAAVDTELARNWALREKLAVLKSAQERLNGIVETPRTEVILNVLKYAAATAPAVAAGQ
ncbi:MAG: hypothetical protein EOP50_12960 [Sphingobacteriales bacterium]|nr:MAG: hypothetical protein EOP50_12960 [Sphingobacteriales bacterium]